MNCQVNIPGCGDGSQSSQEQCDDGNNQNGDGCSAFCIIENGYHCSQTIGCEPCGNGHVDAAEGETCDDGNRVNGDGCSSFCQIEVSPNCGDNYVDAGEQCDDGNREAGDGCSALCKVEDPYLCIQIGHSSFCSLCGNGAQDPGEECDDGNLQPNDGCQDCRKQDGWDCSHSFPTTCARVVKYCGDGKWNPENGEQCDDGDLISSNGCTRECRITIGYECDNFRHQPSVCYPTGRVVCGDGNLDRGQE